MSVICKLHDDAMLLMNEAILLEKENKFEEAKLKFLDACNIELKSASLVEKLPENEPSRSILYLGAASLAWRGEDFEFAERLISEGMNGYPPEQVKKDLMKLLSAINGTIAGK
jgi:hypothetical protein